MSLEWFDRVAADLQDYLESVCDKYDQIGHISINRAAKHPNIDLYVETENQEREIFCTLFFDPHGEEFYIEEFDLELEQTSRIMLADIEDIVDAVHETFHAFLESDELIAEEEYFVDDDLTDDDDDYIWEEDSDVEYGFEEEREYIAAEQDFDMEEFVEQDITIEWTTDEVTAFVADDEIEVAYQFGVVHETGDGVLRRVNRVMINEYEMAEDETTFLFSKEEAGTIVDLIQSNMQYLDEFEDSYDIDDYEEEM